MALIRIKIGVSRRIDEKLFVTEVIKLIEADGWYLVRVKGSHHHFRHPVKNGIVTVKPPDNAIPPKTLASIARQAGIEFKWGGCNEEGQEIAVVFPDLDLATSGIDDADALFSARGALGGRLELMEESGEEIPAPSKASDIAAAPNERVSLVDVYMPSVRMEGVTKAVKRTVTLPAWLNANAMELGINFSQVLQEALQKRIGVA